ERAAETQRRVLVIRRRRRRSELSRKPDLALRIGERKAFLGLAILSARGNGRLDTGGTCAARTDELAEFLERRQLLAQLPEGDLDAKLLRHRETRLGEEKRI